jgi:hypothetical protein
VLGDAQRTFVERLPCENISVHGMCRAVGVSIRWLMGFMSARLTALPEPLYAQPVASPRAVRLGRLEVAAAERGRFVKRQATKPWVGSAMDKQTRPSMACHVGERSHASAQQVWANLPVVDRERATFYTEQ